MAALDVLRSFWAVLSGGAPGDASSRGSARDRQAAGNGAGTGPARQGAGEFDTFLDDLTASVGSGVDLEPGRVPAALPAAGVDDGGPQQLFAEIAATHAQPVKDFIFELNRGTATKDWIDVCMPVLGSIIHGAESLDLHAVAQRIVDFRDALAQVEADGGAKSTFDAESRAFLLARYGSLVEAMPATFDLGQETRQRETIIIHSLLRQIPEVGRVSLEKLYAAGLTSLDRLFVATPAEMSSTTGIPPWLCESICGKLRDHRSQLEREKAESSKGDLRERLARLVCELRSHQQRLQRITAARRSRPDGGAEKRACLRDRQACTLKIDVLLAELGEVARVEELRKLAVARRIDRLEQWLGPEMMRAAAAAAAPAPGRGEGNR
jgi:hypothetical protein